MFKFITSKPLWVNILGGIALIALLIMLFFMLLGSITGHNNYIKVPSVLSQNIDAAKSSLTNAGFGVEVIDSVYDASVGALAVIRQSPEPDATVKIGRTIYLTINRAAAPQVEMPNLVGFSFRSAGMYLQTVGLKMGDITYKADIAKNTILQQLYNGNEIKPGTKLPIGSVISFVVANGVGEGEVEVPNLIGLTYEQAKAQLGLFSISIGSVVAVDAIGDSTKAFVVKQTPDVFSEPNPGQKQTNKIRPGQVIDLYLSINPPAKDSIQ
ncbi:MAG: PASTA domain-containing protein [Sphingobacteriia bacterium]|nr:PASTA domain-containing protein [Sphingobacteriia bacterium]